MPARRFRAALGFAILSASLTGCIEGAVTNPGSSTSSGASSSSSSSTASSSSSSSASSSSSGSGSSGASGSTGSSSSGSTGSSGSSGSGAAPTVLFPKTALDASELALLVNDQDPQSVAVAAYYQQQRGIPAANVVHLSFAATGSANISETDFAAVEADVLAKTPAGTQAYAVSWTKPTRVDCMSLTTALAFGGFDTRFCNTSGGVCGVTATDPYFNTSSVAPFTDYGVRPTMVLAGADVASAEALIDRGVAADDTYPTGQGWLIRTTDTARSVRYPQFISTQQAFDHDGGLTFSYLDNSAGGASDFIHDQQDVLFYFTGLSSVPSIDTNAYLPGAVADHLTSYGGSIPSSGQMSILDWLSAGATASYGTELEPCNYTAKFPDTTVMVPRYFRGGTVLEAYWKSVQWPGEGLFIGEPLARPWGHPRVDFTDGTLTIQTTLLEPAKIYELDAAPAAAGPWTAAVSNITVPDNRLEAISLPNASAPFYRLAETP